MKNTVTVALQTYNFEKRLTWMLSGLAQQAVKPQNVRIDSLDNEKELNAQKVIDGFDNKFDIEHVPWDDKMKFQFRGNVRNKQLAECKTEWMMFVDTDMVYHPEFFERLDKELDNHKDATYMLHTYRFSQRSPETSTKVVDKYQYPCIIDNAFDTAMSNGLQERKMNACGAGFFQLINMNHCPHGGFYVRRTYDGAWFGDNARGQYARSDMKFRRRVSADNTKVRLPKWFGHNQIHLNHMRDSMVEGTITEQR